MSDGEEYEIESILEARVEKERGRRHKVVWKFRVRWKGYSPEEDTWEPIENMVGSEETVSRFWERINTSGRDYRDLEQFEAGEVFLPVGPPRKRKAKEKEKSPTKEANSREDVIEVTSEPERTSSTRIRKRVCDDDTSTGDEHSSKRPRFTFESFSSKPNLLLTDAGSPVKGTSLDVPSLDVPLQEKPQSFGSPRPQIISNISTPASSKNVQPTIPLHRARVAHPLVKILQDHHTSSLGSHEVNKPDSETQPATEVSARARKRSKPGPGRSSDGLLIRPTLLTSVKGKLESIRGKKLGSHTEPANDEGEGAGQVTEIAVDREIPADPPKPEELLQLAGLDSGSATLPDYEDECSAATAPLRQVSGIGESLSSTVGESLFPSTVPYIENNSVWKHSTIFGPLGLGADTLGLDTNTNTDESSMPFQVNLDSSVSIPILLVDTVSSSAFPKSALSQRGPPGKFYRGSYAIDLLGTLRTKGSFARVRLSREATESQDRNFRLFVKRLSDDDLFVIMVDQDLLAFCSSTNALFTQRLNVPSSLLSVETALVTHVSIENYCAFANAALNADDAMWSRYILSVGDV